MKVSFHRHRGRPGWGARLWFARRWLQLGWFHHAPIELPPRVVDMNKEIALLDPDASAFTTMLMRLKPHREYHHFWGYHRDTRLWGDWRWCEVAPPQLYEALEHFERQMLAAPDRVAWLEDELFPRVLG